MNKDIGKIYQEAFKDFEQEPPKDLFNAINRSWNRQTNFKLYKKWAIAFGITVAVLSAVILLPTKIENVLSSLQETSIESLAAVPEMPLEVPETVVIQETLKPEIIILTCCPDETIIVPDSEFYDIYDTTFDSTSIASDVTKIKPQSTNSNDNFKETSKEVNKVQNNNDFLIEKIDSTIYTKNEPFWEIEEEKPAIFIPSAFSPDGDGINETFKIETVQDFTTFEWSVYSKIGKMLYHTKSVHGYWDGTFKGQPMPRDMYIYIVSYTDKQGQKQQLKGSFMLLK